MRQLPAAPPGTLPVIVHSLLRTVGVTLLLGSLGFVLLTVPFYKLGHGLVYDSVEEIPARQVALLLGTSKYSRSGRPSEYYHSRITAAADLYHHGKVQYILASGDNLRASYNEPQRMKETLIALGVAPDAIHLDSAGLRTLDSVIRARTVFDLNDYTIITQRSHLLRALYIAYNDDQRPIGFASHTPQGPRNLQFQARETLARLRALIDVHITNTQPRIPAGAAGTAPAEPLPF